MMMGTACKALSLTHITRFTTRRNSKGILDVEGQNRVEQRFVDFKTLE